MTGRCAVRELCPCRAFQNVARKGCRHDIVLSILLAPRLEAHLSQIALRALRELRPRAGRRLPSGNVAVSSVSLDIREPRTPLARLSASLAGCSEPFGPEIRAILFVQSLIRACRRRRSQRGRSSGKRGQTPMSWTSISSSRTISWATSSGMGGTPLIAAEQLRRRCAESVTSFGGRIDRHH
jgi:hypothetical protein